MQIGLVKDFSWLDINLLDGFLDDVREILSLNELITKKRIDKIVNEIEIRINYIKNLMNNYNGDQMKKCVLVYNPNSGKGKVKKYLSDIISIIRDKGYDVDVFCSKYKGHTIEIVRDIKCADLVMSFGGDGTFNEGYEGKYAQKKQVSFSSYSGWYY